MITDNDVERAKSHLTEFWGTLRANLPAKVANEIEAFGFIAGGAIRSALLNEPIKDYDIFFDNSHSPDDAARYLDQAIEANVQGATHIPFKRHFQTANAHSFIFEFAGQKHQIQFVKKFYGNPMDVVNKFDFTHSMAYYQPNGIIYVDDKMKTALDTKSLVFNVDCYSPTHSTGRAAKFLKRGWTIDKASLQLMAYAVGKEAYTVSNEDNTFATEYPTVERFKAVMSSKGTY